MDSRKAEGMRFTINLITPDNGEKFVIELGNATLTQHANEFGIGVRPKLPQPCAVRHRVARRGYNPRHSRCHATLAQIELGDSASPEQLLPLVYNELRKLVAVKLSQEKPGQTLQAMTLFHEAFVRLVQHPNDSRSSGYPRTYGTDRIRSKT